MSENTAGGEVTTDAVIDESTTEQAIGLMSPLGLVAPAEPLDLRWRLANRKLPLYERHLHSLTVYGVSSPLQAWIRSRLEWTLDNVSARHSDGVLHIAIDPTGDVVIEVTQSLEAPTFTVDDLRIEEGVIVGVDLSIEQSSEERCSTTEGVIWVGKGGRLIASTVSKPVSATNTFIHDLATTLRYEPALELVTIDEIASGDVELFFATDEFGVIPCAGFDGPITKRMTECFEKLWSRR